MKARVEVRHYILYCKLCTQCTTRCTVLVSIDTLIQSSWEQHLPFQLTTVNSFLRVRTGTIPVLCGGKQLLRASALVDLVYFGSQPVQWCNLCGEG